MQRLSSWQKALNPRSLWRLLVGLVPVFLLGCSVETELREDSFVVGGSPENTLRTSDGSIDAILVETPGVEVDASTNNGKVKSQLPITISGETSEDHLVGAIGAGGRHLLLRTSNGSITIR